uniref:Integrase catalytic domain-containing protein n=1 Tax=Fagus sylvatica TaxID=28930 RepID=A0A2N9GZE0_FAGSY
MNLVVDDELQALLLLSSLPNSWETLVMSLSNFAPNGVLQLAMVKDSLFNEETRRKDMGKDDAQALVTENKGRSKGRNSKGRGKSRSQSQTKGKVKCFYCDKEGHIKRNCKAWKNKQKEETNKKKVDDHNTATVSLDEDVVVLSIGKDECCHVVDPYDEWVIDSAASLPCHSKKGVLYFVQSRKLRQSKDGRLAHMSEKGLQILAKKSLIPFAKDQVFQLFKKFHAMVEREKGKFLKCLRTDNGGEYTSNEFENYYSKYGIRHEKTVPGTPQHNGVAERINRTIVEKSPSIPLDFDIPERVWTGEDASYTHLKLWDPKKEKMIISRDVVFHENENITNFEKSENSKSTVEGVFDLTPTSSSSDIATDIEEVQVENYDDEPAGVGGDDAIDTEANEHKEQHDQPTRVDGDNAIDTKDVEEGEQPIPPEMEEPQVTRSTRERRPSTKYSTSKLGSFGQAQ